jgi:type II secretory pathway pseudopilin PulG
VSFFLVQAASVLLMISLLGAVVAPAASDAVNSAKILAATHDLQSLASALMRLIDDVGPRPANGRAWTRYDLLVGPGATPESDSLASSPWASEGAAVGFLDDHLVSDDAGYGRAAPTVRPGWRGPYLQSPVHDDPWGNRYAVNVAAAALRAGNTVVLSAGVDGRVQSSFITSGSPQRPDDLAVLVGSDPLR